MEFESIFKGSLFLGCTLDGSSIVSVGYPFSKLGSWVRCRDGQDGVFRGIYPFKTGASKPFLRGRIGIPKVLDVINICECKIGPLYFFRRVPHKKYAD